MKMSILSLLLISMMPAAAAGGDELAGARPGPEGQPLIMNGTLFLLDVSKIDGADQSFTADLFMMLQWKDERLASEADGLRRMPFDNVWNPRIQIINQRRIWKTFPEEVDVSPNGTVTYRQRYYGTFSSPLDLHDFPLDHHPFRLQIVIPGYGPDEIDFMPISVATLLPSEAVGLDLYQQELEILVEIILQKP